MSILALNPTLLGQNRLKMKLSNYFFFNFRTRDAIFDPKDGSVQMHLRGKPIQFFAPSDTKNSYSLFESQHSKLAKLPDMKLEWVYGYRSIIFKLLLFLFNLPKPNYFCMVHLLFFNLMVKIVVIQWPQKWWIEKSRPISRV